MLSLSDLMSHAGLRGYAEMALILFFAVFVAIVFRVYAPSRRREMETMARLPLADDQATPEPEGEPR